jgi:hypothetical protein
MPTADRTTPREYQDMDETVDCKADLTERIRRSLLRRMLADTKFKGRMPLALEIRLGPGGSTAEACYVAIADDGAVVVGGRYSVIRRWGSPNLPILAFEADWLTVESLSAIARVVVPPPVVDRVALLAGALAEYDRLRGVDDVAFADSAASFLMDVVLYLEANPDGGALAARMEAVIAWAEARVVAP